MINGTISGNYAKSNGGGVFVRGSNCSFTMEGGTISGNSAESTNDNYGGGGVSVTTYATFIMSDGTISGNFTNSNGGGVFVNSSNGSFTMDGGTISGNSAERNGGGVYVKGSFSKNGGFIGGDNDNIAYKDDPTNGTADDNTAKAGNTKGHAVFYTSGSRFRDTKLESEDNISTTNTGSGSGWSP
jgi:predicted outer membrane repeat protein